MKKLLAISALGLCCVLPAQAQTNVGGDVNAAARELVVAMNTRQMMTSAVRTLQPAMKNMAAEKIRSHPTATAEQKAAQLAKLESSSPMILQELQAIMSDPGFNDEIEAMAAASYAKHYSVDEIKQLTAFYKSPVGLKMLSVTPQIAQESMLSMQKILMPRVAAMAQKFATAAATP